MDSKIKEQIENNINSNDVFLFMKGTPEFPQCGFSGMVCGVLKKFDVTFSHCNVLADNDIREGVKEFSEWPTIPQLYIKGEFVGGSDIVKEMVDSGEIVDLFESKKIKHSYSKETS